ncbi:hypothetical protein GCM10027612_66500 [Microbispora bryophytorum subsp. camponoti]
MGRRDLLVHPRPPAWRRALVAASSAALTLGLATVPAMQAQAAPALPAAQLQAQAKPNPPEPDTGKPDKSDESVSVLVFHGPAKEQSDPVEKAADSIKNLGKDNGFSIEVSEDPAVFTSSNLARYRGVVFLSATGVTLNAAQEAAFQAYIRDGGGFVGVHDAVRAQPDSSWFTELVGTRPAGSLPPAEKVVEVTASGDNPPNETKEKLVDGNNNSKWLTFNPTGWVSLKPEQPKAIAHYALTSANDFPGRDPKDWTLQGSQDGKSWTDLDKRTGRPSPRGSRPRNTRSPTPRRTRTTG